MYHIVYTSTATDVFNDSKFSDFLSLCRENNKQWDVSGILIYDRGRFFQMIEGPKERILDLFENRISKDKRHKDIKVLLNEETDRRLFDSWNMAFRRMNELPANLQEKINTVLSGSSENLNTSNVFELLQNEVKTQ